MKKLILAAILLAGFTGITYAQAPPQKMKTKHGVTKTKTDGVKSKTGTDFAKTKTNDSKTKTKADPGKVKTTGDKTKEKNTVVTTKTKTPTGNTKMKQVGAASAGPVKKDGTPDKRFTANKKVKKDGKKQ